MIDYRTVVINLHKKKLIMKTGSVLNNFTWKDLLRSTGFLHDRFTSTAHRNANLGLSYLSGLNLLEGSYMIVLTKWVLVVCFSFVRGLYAINQN